MFHCPTFHTTPTYIIISSYNIFFQFSINVDVLVFVLCSMSVLHRLHTYKSSIFTLSTTLYTSLYLSAKSPSLTSTCLSFNLCFLCCWVSYVQWIQSCISHFKKKINRSWEWVYIGSMRSLIDSLRGGDIYRIIISGMRESGDYTQLQQNVVINHNRPIMIKWSRSISIKRYSFWS
jgi:hypothetical protein